MAAIRGRDTKPEMIVRKGLWSRGFRYRLNHKRLPGHPDLVLRKYRTCIFVNGCFWHGHNVAEPRMSDVRCKMEDVIEKTRRPSPFPLPLGRGVGCEKMSIVKGQGSRFKGLIVNK